MADPVRVFISYSTKDRPIVKRLMEDLKQAGVEVWFDHEQLKPGTCNWTAAVVRGIEQATDVIYAASPDAANSVYVGHELAIARDEGKEDHILPFWVRGEKWSRCVPFGYYYAQYIDGRDAAYASGLAKLLTTLGVASPAPAAFLPQPTPPNVRPVGGRLDGFLSEAALRGRLIPDNAPIVTLENRGDSIAWNISAALFPLARYLKPEGALQNTLALSNTHWHQQMGLIGVIMLLPGHRESMWLGEANGPLRGDDSVIPGFSLCPALEQQTLGDEFDQYDDESRLHSARLTVTYRDRFTGAKLATVTDYDTSLITTNRTPWRQVTGPTEVQNDLDELWDRVAHERWKPQN